MVRSNAFARTVLILVGGFSILLASAAHASRRADVTSVTDGTCLVLEWVDPHRLLPAGERWMAKETTRILDDAGISARWDWSRDDGGERASSASEHRLRVVLVPSEPSGPGWGLAANTLGATVLDGKAAPPAVYIFYHSVISILRPERGPRGGEDPRFLARASRALGRVVAHEVAHAIAPGEPHASSGLMQAGLAPSLLIANRNVAIDDQWELVLGAGLSRLCS